MVNGENSNILLFLIQNANSTSTISVFSYPFNIQHCPFTIDHSQFTIHPFHPAHYQFSVINFQLNQSFRIAITTPARLTKPLVRPTISAVLELFLSASLGTTISLPGFTLGYTLKNNKRLVLAALPLAYTI
jgi:hypothetical protein